MMTEPTHSSNGTVAELKLVQRLLEEQPTRHSGVFGICTELIDDGKRSHENAVGYCIQLGTRDGPTYSTLLTPERGDMVGHIGMPLSPTSVPHPEGTS